MSNLRRRLILWHAVCIESCINQTNIMNRQFESNALMDLTHFRIFRRTSSPDFTHYSCEQQRKMEIYE
jgi:hypothetical protein